MGSNPTLSAIYGGIAKLVRQQVLILLYVGPNPATPATIMRWKFVRQNVRTLCTEMAKVQCVLKCSTHSDLIDPWHEHSPKIDGSTPAQRTLYHGMKK